jgi:hypothetical protein
MTILLFIMARAALSIHPEDHKMSIGQTSWRFQLEYNQQCCCLQTPCFSTGERILLRCLDMRPQCIEARMLLMQNLIAQNRQGRSPTKPYGDHRQS